MSCTPCYLVTFVKEGSDKRRIKNEVFRSLDAAKAFAGCDYRGALIYEVSGPEESPVTKLVSRKTVCYTDHTEQSVGGFGQTYETRVSGSGKDYDDLEAALVRDLKDQLHGACNSAHKVVAHLELTYYET